MIPKITQDPILVEIRDNMRKLQECSPPHEFEEDKSDKGLLKRSVCKKCGGRVDHSRAVWYELGLKHSGALK